MRISSYLLTIPDVECLSTTFKSWTKNPWPPFQIWKTQRSPCCWNNPTNHSIMKIEMDFFVSFIFVYNYYHHGALCVYFYTYITKNSARFFFLLYIFVCGCYMGVMPNLPKQLLHTEYLIFGGWAKCDYNLPKKLPRSWKLRHYGGSFRFILVCQLKSRCKHFKFCMYILVNRYLTWHQSTCIFYTQQKSHSD